MAARPKKKKKKNAVTIGHKVPKFEELNSYSHKRWTTNVGSPAIIWHRAYWKPAGLDEDTWHQLINEYIAATLRRLRGRVDRVRQPPPPTRKDLSAYAITFTKDSVKVSIVFEKFDEFWSIKTIVDYSRVSRADQLKTWLKRIFNALKACEIVIVARLVSRLDPDQVNDLVRTQSRRISAALVTMTADLFPRTPDHADMHRGVISIDDLFANFIGFSFGFEAPGNQLVHADHLSPLKQGRVIDNVSPSSIMPEDADGLGTLVDAIWPVARWLNPYVAFTEHGSLATIAPPEHADELTREFTISRLNRGRALYVTSLGGMRSDPTNSIYFPLSYLMICPHKATWQIGRIIDRIHTLGMFRLATMRNYDAIEESDREMRNLINKVNGPEPDVQDVSRKFDSLRPELKDGLHYRIEWSKYYLSIYRETMRSLDFGRVEGYQTYPEFVSRKFLGRFATIESVSSRYDYLARQIRTKTNQSAEATIKDLLTTAELASIVPISYYIYHVLDMVNDGLLRAFGPVLHWSIFFLVWLGLSARYVLWVFRNWRNRSRLGFWAAVDRAARRALFRKPRVAKKGQRRDADRPNGVAADDATG